MGINAAREDPPGLHGPPAAPPPDTVEVLWIGTCGVRAQALRGSAMGASQYQAERAVIELGAAAALDHASYLWAGGRDGEAVAWMRAAENVLASALIPIPWRQGT
jgi:hypothetical protein